MATANSIKKLLDGLRAVCPLDRQFSDRLKSVTDALFVRFGIGRSLRRIRQVYFVAGIRIFRIGKTGPQLAKICLLAGVFVASRAQLLLEIRSLLARVPLFTLESFDLRRYSGTHLGPAGHFIAETRLSPDRFKLLLPQLFDAAVLQIAV